MDTPTLRQKVTEQVLGFKVERATATPPATTTDEIFAVVGGKVLVTALIGEVTTAIQNQTCNLKVTHNPDTGTSADVASNLDIANDEIGTLYIVEGDGTALVGVNAGTGWPTGTTRGWIANTGAIDIETGATNTGSIKWTIFYVPIDAGAYIEAA